MFYITINRCIITIRINTALIDYLANIGNSIGLIKTQSVSLSRNIYNNLIANCKNKNFDPPFTTPCQGKQQLQRPLLAMRSKINISDILSYPSTCEGPADLQTNLVHNEPQNYFAKWSIMHWKIIRFVKRELQVYHACVFFSLKVQVTVAFRGCS